MMNQDYHTEALRLAKAVEIAIDSFTKFPPKDFTNENIDLFVKVYSECKPSIFYPEPKFKKIASLKYHVQDVFTFFQESSGDAVEYFWKQIDKESLGYVREDKLRKIIERGEIKGRIEYDLVVDCIVAAEQEKRITSEGTSQLNEMLIKFESRKKNKK